MLGVASRRSRLTRLDTRIHRRLAPRAVADAADEHPLFPIVWERIPAINAALSM